MKANEFVLLFSEEKDCSVQSDQEATEVQQFMSFLLCIATEQRIDNRPSVDFKMRIGYTIFEIKNKISTHADK